MNLLEHIQKNLDAPKKALAVQLLNKPWNTDISELRKYVPKELYRRFVTLKKDVLARVHRLDGKRPPFARIAVEAIAVGLHAQEGEGAMAGGPERQWVDQIWAQVVEDLEDSGRESGLLDEADRAAFVLLYTLAHACLFVIANVHVPMKGSNLSEVVLSRDPNALIAHRLYWFAHYMSVQSLLSDHLMIRTLMEEAWKAERPMHRVFHAASWGLNVCRDYFADKYLSLHPDYMRLMNEKDHPAIDAFTERLGLIVYVYLCGIRQQLDSKKLDGTLRFDSLLPFNVCIKDLREAGFHGDVIRELLTECLRRPVGDRFLVEIGGGQLQIGDLSLKYALQIYCHRNLSDMKFRGNWFEEGYIANYIRERVPGDRYRVFGAVSDKSQNYDADVIIEDLHNGTLLFCQVKHRATTVLPHLRDEMKEYIDNSQILHGLEQIKNLRALIGSDGVLTRVRQRIGQRKLTSQALGKRARYLLIHNIENLDFCTSDGVAMYEWNTLRNIMKGTMNIVADGGATLASIAEMQIALEDPHQVMEAICGWIEKGLLLGPTRSPSLDWNLLRSGQLMFHTRRVLYLKKVRLFACGGFRLSLPLT